MASLKDIAAELDISIGLVSKVLSGHLGTTGVSPATQRRILKTARALKYEPNRQALALRLGRKGVIGVYTNPWGAPGSEMMNFFLCGISEKLMSTSYHTWLTLFEDGRQFRKQQIIPEDIHNRVDALIVRCVPKPKLLQRLVQLEQTGTPVVTIFCGMVNRGTINICVDERQQGRLGTEHLILRGCRRIAHFRTVEVRYQGYVEAHREAGLKFDPRLVIPTPTFNIEDGRIATGKLVRTGLPFDGIMAQSDHQALAAVQELQARGIRVPHDVRVIGIDDGPICLASPVKLTSVTSECRELGRLAVETALKRLAGEQVESRLIAPRIIVREST